MTHNAEHRSQLSSEPNSQSSSDLPSFNNSTVDNHHHHHHHRTPLTSLSFPSTVLPDFEAPLQLASFQQEVHGKFHQESWQNPVTHLEKPIRMPSNSPFSFAPDNCGAPAFSNYGNPHQSFTDMTAGNWDGKLAYMLSSANGLSGNPMSLLARTQMSEGSSVVEMMANLPSNGGAKGEISSMMGSSQPYPDMEKLFNDNWGSFSPNVGLTVDPSKGGLAIQGVNLSAGHNCLPTFSTDLGLAERAAKFSCFNKQPMFSSSSAQLAQSAAYQLVGDGGKSNLNSNRLARVGSQAKLIRVPSGLGSPPRSSAPNSPNGCNVVQKDAVKQTQEVSASAANNTKANVNSNLVIMEEPKMNLDKKPSLFTTLIEIDGSEGTQKHCTSINESDESMGQEVSSSCGRTGGCETASHGENPGKKKRTKNKAKDGAARISNLKDLETDELKGKRHKSGEDANEEDPKKRVEQSISANSGDSTPKSVKESSKPPEPPKPDYIHVRARRGQATDSHSLAERIRREKISERMKYLQDLVPGCNKVTGKAIMLDEIINYVQSLQRQVEFLSMKLAAVNPRVEFNMDSLFGREIIQPRVPPHQPLMFSTENPNSYPPLHHQQSQAPLQVGGSCLPVDVHSLGGSDPALRRTISTPLGSMDAYGDSVSQISQAWDDELQSVVQMSFAQGRQTPLTSPSLQGQLFTGQMKVEL